MCFHFSFCVCCFQFLPAYLKNLCNPTDLHFIIMFEGGFQFEKFLFDFWWRQLAAGRSLKLASNFFSLNVTFVKANICVSMLSYYFASNRKHFLCSIHQHKPTNVKMNSIQTSILLRISDSILELLFRLYTKPQTFEIVPDADTRIQNSRNSLFETHPLQVPFLVKFWPFRN